MGSKSTYNHKNWWECKYNSDIKVFVDSIISVSPEENGIGINFEANILYWYTNAQEVPVYFSIKNLILKLKLRMTILMWNKNVRHIK